jgi:segregation and condensation protein A
MLQKTDDGEHISIQNPFDRSIAIAFELVTKQHLNPWDIDLVNFSTMYLKRAKEEKIDLVTAGRIILLAWKVLRLQSDNLVLTMEENNETYEPLDWGDIPQEMWFSEDDAYSYTNLIMKTPEPPIDVPMRRSKKRKVTLIELLDAFDQAKKDSEEYQIIEKQREQERIRISEKARKRMKGTAHEDPLEKDIKETWDKIKSIPKKTFLLSDLHSNKSREEMIKILMSVLFLAYDNKITIYQKRFPYGKIYIKNNFT